MGMILAVFFGGGMVLISLVNRSGGGNQAGLDTFIFSQAASMVRNDVISMSILAVVVILIVIIGFKEWKLFLFDPDFGKGLKLSVKGMNIIYLRGFSVDDCDWDSGSWRDLNVCVIDYSTCQCTLLDPFL